MDKIDNKPLVAIHCLVYNHEPYLRDCFEGFVMQQTNFPFVAIVHDDASTDGSAAIIREYEAKYPHIFKPIFEKKNLYSIGKYWHIEDTMRKKIKNTGAKYVAMCEGDDYWINPLKLQKQVDFMERNEEYSLCFTNSIVRFNGCESMAIKHIWDTYTIEDVIKNNASNVKIRGDEIVTCGHTSTVLYRNPKLPLPKWTTECFVGDEPLFIALSQYGKVKFINETTSVYRDGVGVSSKDFNEEEYWKNRISMYNIINRGLEYKYDTIIVPIVSEIYLVLSKIMWKTNDKRNAIRYLYNLIMTNPKLFIKWIIHRLNN